MKLTVAVDYDGTFGADIPTFRSIVRTLQAAGHQVVMVTQRSAEQGAVIRGATRGLGIPIVWASGKPKLEAAREAGYDVDIWMEDNPLSIFEALVYAGPVEEG